MAAGMVAATTTVEDAVDLRDEPVALSRVTRVVVAAASLGAAAVHSSAIADHGFDPFHAAAFVAMATFQAGWAYAVLRSTAGRVLAAGAAGHGAVVVLWVLSRTGGVPDWLPGAGGREAVGLKDLAATALAVVVLAGIDLLSRRDVAARCLRASRAGAAVGALVLAIAVAAVAGSFTAGHAHVDGSHTGAAHDH